MMYEVCAIRRQGIAHSASSYDGTTDDGSPPAQPAWQNPYGASRFPACAKPFMLVLSDVNPSYDSDQLPG